ncbi:DUF1819 family protein [Geobacter benzoatilyticus]|uniref:DUF1819 family protein n=1 Tax=Geobacter benzoatilyticus TaxID=2815309 RepID=A0ABX7Q216_9BACT|nr:DUF1819 family protein [Geobacter benzoatilyticus]QSV44986.1 DUF1819 family protein [Geobacter benzoatilyticus]
MSFTAGGLFLRESVEIAELFLTQGDWKAVRYMALNQNLIQSRTASSSKRVCREICLRLEKLHEAELNVLIEGSLQEQQQILWVGICRRHRFIYEFASEIIREKYLQINLDLRPEDYDAFFNAKAEWHDELEQLTESTRNKLRQVVFRMLREADILTKANSINPVILSAQVARAVASHSPDDLKIFPLSDRDIRELLQ